MSLTLNDPSALQKETNSGAVIEDFRKREYHKLDEQNHVYLDFTGASLNSSTQLEAHHSFLQNNILGNPHSVNPTSQLATKYINETRDYVLNYFNAVEDYYCVFTQNASGALKIVGECYPFNANSAFVLTFDNHNSVNGIRVFAKNKGSDVAYCPVFIEDLRLDTASMDRLLTHYKDKKNKLLAFPAQSNVSGVKHPLSLIQKAKDLGWDVLLDAAAFVPTNNLNLQEVKPDFVSVSFYKIFGYPTGVGCLLINKKALPKLQKPWFAGGTVSLVSILADSYILADTHERFEDGTLDFQNIPAVKTGLQQVEKIGMHHIQRNILELTQYLLDELAALKHSNGVALVHILGPKNNINRGGTVLLNFFDNSEKPLPFADVEEKANSANISFRTGCFCNPGIDEINNCLSTGELVQYFSTHETGDYNDMIKHLGKMRGAIRISLGIASIKKDADAFIKFAKSFLQ
ncbi:MAG: aminotransferase class V-fold PLP-dependent enzyme [Chitinophagaceae bacterium]|nr:aminotransferase class V-fold PLP-dependent enzyme [Chitinophagaceae bacterium]